MGNFTAREKAECAEREAGMRREVYPRRNNGNPMTAFQKRQIALMEEIAADYRRQDAESGGDLFPESESEQ